MYRPQEGLFVFRLRRGYQGVVAEGLSRRYSAIVLIGLAAEEPETASAVLAGQTPHTVCARLMHDVPRMDNLGDVALTLWAAGEINYPDRCPARDRLVAMVSGDGAQATVELAWALAALSVDMQPRQEQLRERLARRLVSSLEPRSVMFPHVVGGNGSGLRSHVLCFADLVYPIHALALHSRLSGDREAGEVALRCALQVCRLQGEYGQWWWHYDRRTGKVIEGYPVYSVHQDAMAPMALWAVQDAGNADFTRELEKGLTWLARPPELDGGSLLDEEADLLWRKVARREPGRLSRYVQAAATRLHPDLRVPGLDRLFPARVVDYEDRPYHLGWLLYAWSPARAAHWKARHGNA